MALFVRILAGVALWTWIFHRGSVTKSLWLLLNTHDTVQIVIRSRGHGHRHSAPSHALIQVIHCWASFFSLHALLSSFDRLFSWIPLYSTVRTIAVLLFLCVRVVMSTHLYDRLLVPFFREHEGRIDTFLEFLHIASTFAAYHVVFVPLEHVAARASRIPIGFSSKTPDMFVCDFPLPGGLARAPLTPPATPLATALMTPPTAPRTRPRRTPKTPKRSAIIQPAVAERVRRPALDQADKPRRFVRRDPPTSTQALPRPTAPRAIALQPPVSSRPDRVPAPISVNVPPKREATARSAASSLPKAARSTKPTSAVALAPLTPGRKRRAARDDEPEPSLEAKRQSRRAVAVTLEAGGIADTATSRPPPVKRRRVERVAVGTVDGLPLPAPRSAARKRRGQDVEVAGTETENTRRTRLRQARDVRADGLEGKRRGRDEVLSIT